MPGRFVVMCSLVVILVAALFASAGQLDPPTGSIAPTFKTLDQVEPRIPIGPETTPGTSSAVFRIDVPGSYYLTSNVTGERPRTPSAWWRATSRSI